MKHWLRGKDRLGRPVRGAPWEDWPAARAKWPTAAQVAKAVMWLDGQEVRLADGTVFRVRARAVGQRVRDQ